LLIKELAYINYRGLNDSTEELDRINHIVGKNGTGKTSIVEAAAVLLSGRSFQGITLNGLSNKENNFFSLSGLVAHTPNNTDKIKLAFTNGKKTHTLNSKRLGPQAAHKTFPLCLIDTNVIQASSGQPKYRRDLLDRAVFHVEPQHVTNHKKLNKCLSQRNRSISKGLGIRSVESWDETLAELGESISKSRISLIEEAKGEVAKISKKLLGETISIKYEMGWKDGSYLESLKKNIKKDLAIKRTSTGPQREDFKIMSQERKASGYYSHGQEKLASISFMLGLNIAVEKRKNRSSILIIDEAESGLDSDSTNKLIMVLKSLNNQLLITSLPHHNITKLFSGNILRASQKQRA
tara:strand:+ start:400 stop:1452 length:1053 start_codon:yes stop_codon:yes gene_type:complete